MSYKNGQRRFTELLRDATLSDEDMSQASSYNKGENKVEPEYLVPRSKFGQR